MFLLNWGCEESRALFKPTDDRAGDGGRGVSGGTEDIVKKGGVGNSGREVQLGKTLIELSSLVLVISNSSSIYFYFGDFFSRSTFIEDTATSSSTAA